MLILLPPSEGKTVPAAGPVVDLAGLSFPALTATRRRVLTSLVSLCRSRPEIAPHVLGLGPTQSAQVRLDAGLRTQACAPAREVYAGVLYEALCLHSLTTAARRRADAHVVIASALWGLVRPFDLIPAYRLSSSVSLPGLGTLASAWRGPVAAEIAASDGLVIDLRSSGYASLGPLPPTLAGRAATVRVLVERDGRRSIVSHSNKATKGRLVRALLQSRRTPGSVTALVDELGRAGFRVETPPGAPDRPATVDVVVDHV